MNTIRTNNLKDFTTKYLNTAVSDEVNQRAMRDLNNPSDKNFFAIQRTNLARDLIQFPIPPHRVDFYEILFIEKGSTRRTVDLMHFELKDSSFSLTKPGQIVSDDLISSNIRGYHLYFDQAFVLACSKELLHITLFQPLDIAYNQITPLHFKEIKFLLEKIERLYIDESDNSLLKSYITTLLFELDSIIRKNGTHQSELPISQVAQRYRQMISLQPNIKLSIAYYAEILNTTARSLNREVKNVYGKTPLELKTDSIITNAHVMLADRKMSVTEIALSLGFEDMAYFSRFFKKRTGKTPSEMRG
ncbi:MAG: helix-turn-helix domain-containing protein [Flavobacteriales bacterium]